MGRGHLDDLSIDGRILHYHKERGWEDMQWIHVVQDRDK
jgi:hypothetical protein